MYAYSTDEGTPGRRRSRCRHPASRTTSSPGRRPETTAASTSPGTARRRTRPPAAAPTGVRTAAPTTPTARGACTSRRRSPATRRGQIQRSGVAGEHPVRRGSMQTIIGNQCGGATNNAAAGRTARSATSSSSGSAARARHRSRTPTRQPAQLLLGTHAMYVRQIGGTGVYAGESPKGDSILKFRHRSGQRRDVRGSGQTTANMPNLDIISSKASWPSLRRAIPKKTACLRVTMKLVKSELPRRLSHLTPTTISSG